MVANFQKYLDRGTAAVNRIHGEHITIKPMITNQHSGAVADGSRTTIQTADVLRVSSDQAENLGMGRHRQNIILGAGEAILYLARAGLSAEAVIKKGDIVIATDRPGSPNFRVERVNNRGRARLVIELSALGKSNA